MSNDISISPVSLSNKPTVSNKPSYLITFEDFIFNNGIKEINIKKIVTIDKPDTGASFVQAKGFISDLSEDEIISSYQNLLTEVRREDIIEVMIPWNRIFSVRSLVFKAK